MKTPRKNLKRNLFIFSLLIVPLVHFLVFWLYIKLETISLAFMEWDYFSNTYKFAGIDNFIEQFRQFKARPETMNMFKNAFRAIPINLACLVLAVIIGYAFSKHIRGERIFRAIFYLPSMISIVIQTLCYRYMFTYSPGMLQGPAAELLRMLGVNYNGWETALNDPVVISRIWWLISIFCVWASAGINIILMSSAMSRIPEEVIESAKLDGVGFWRELFQINIPLIMPTVSVFLVNSMMAVSAFYLQPMLLTGNSTGPGSVYNTVGWYMFNIAPKAQDSDMPLISTIGFILTVLVSVLVIVVKKVTDKLTPDVDF
ncbi:MAG: sugar ABC transporter permease [Oscillospiraceae bacterium]|nr:sugar ABC transporter permease [Oscillospiraceae bacterium]